MRHYGTIAHWNEARKFGAILEEYSQKEVFAPLAAFDRTDPPPTVGERVSFEMTVGRRNRDEAADIRYMDRFADEEEGGFQAEASDSVKKTALTAFIAGLIAFGGYYGYHYVAENSGKIIPHQQNEVIVKQVAEQIHADRQAWKAAVSGSGHGKAVKTESQPQEKAKADDSIGGRIMQLFNKEESRYKEESHYKEESLYKEESRYKCDGRQYCSEMTSLDEARYFVKHCPNTKMDGDHDGEPCESDSRWR